MVVTGNRRHGEEIGRAEFIRLELKHKEEEEEEKEEIAIEEE